MTIFLKSLKNRGYLDGLSMTIAQIGSRKLSEKDDYGSQEWHTFAPNLTIYGFDADADACEAANADLDRRKINWTERHIPLVLSDAIGEAILYVTKHPMCSSLYPPNEVYLGRLAGLSELVNLDFTVELETTTLDAFCKSEDIQEIDFLQIDVQGADLDVLKGAANLLAHSVLAIQIEVEFAPLYSGQPLFSDIDFFLRPRGFTLFELTHAYRHRAISPIYGNMHRGQLLWGDAFYLRDLLDSVVNPLFKTPKQMLKLACIADIFGFSDFTFEMLSYLTSHYGEEPKFDFREPIDESLRHLSHPN